MSRGSIVLLLAVVIGGVAAVGLGLWPAVAVVVAFAVGSTIQRLLDCDAAPMVGL